MDTPVDLAIPEQEIFSKISRSIKGLVEELNLPILRIFNLPDDYHFYI